MKEEYAGISDSSEFKAGGTNNSKWPVSVKKAMGQYNTRIKAERFALNIIGTATDRREKRCIKKALSLTNVPGGALVLDLPCGGGRLLPLLKERGYWVTAADVSEHMLEEAVRYSGSAVENCPDKRDSFVVANIFQTGFEDNFFEMVICHRLLQYFSEARVRQQALKELARICSGPIVVSFLCNFSADAMASQLRSAIRHRRPRGCRPVSYRDFAEDARAAGLVVKKWIPMRGLVSKRWFAILERDDTGCNKTSSPCCTILWNTLSRMGAVAAIILAGFFIATHFRAIAEPHEYSVERIVKKYQDGNDHFYVSNDSHLEDLRTGKTLSILSSITEVSEKIAIDYTELEDSFFIVSHKELSNLRKSPVWRQLTFIRRVNIMGEEFVLFTTEGKSTLTRPRTHEFKYRGEGCFCLWRGRQSSHKICEILV